MNKRGNIGDLAWLMILLCTFAFMAIIGLYIWNSFYTAITPQLTASSVDTSFATKINSAYAILDYAGIVIYLSLTLMSVIGAYYVDTHPVFFGFSIIALVFLIMVSALLSNTFGVVFANFAESSSYPLTLYIISHLPTFILVSGASILFSLYAKPRGNF